MESAEYESALHNEAVLRNSVEFTTAQRAFVATIPPINTVDQMD